MIDPRIERTAQRTDAIMRIIEQSGGRRLTLIDLMGGAARRPEHRVAPEPCLAEGGAPRVNDRAGA
jgi:hypothetical protein